MAALRHAARRLGVGALQRAPRVSPVHRPMSNTSAGGKPQTTAGPCDELRAEFEEAKEELFDLCMEMRSRGAFKTMSWEDIQNLRLTSHLAAQVKPKPDDAMWRRYKRHRTFHDFQSAYFCLGFIGYSFLTSNKNEDGGQSEASISSLDTEPASERLN
ncbi:uncharacterized protein [Lolium perenne]|uniref:uncharacterized protein n=1 Tax=Lolium perenne TaxID=4522 RepID=UPI0021EA9BEF|nr:uncharacterized protein LOC127327825 [Lolium perenne]